MMKIRLSTTCLLLVLLNNPGWTQPGCPDPLASNFNPGAAQNDGSCVYPITNYAPVFKASVVNDLREISGLHLANGAWWAHNDSGFDPEFYEFSPLTGNIIKKIGLKNAHNRDWEDVCSDASNLYFGDFGNNTNDRENLGIYRVPFNAIGNSNNQTVEDNEYSFIPFGYPDQTDFSTQPEDSTRFDCEAMLYAQGKLHLFTKNRKEYTTTHYTLNPANGIIQKIETFNVNGLITGASISPDGQMICLVGYDLRGLPSVFCWLLWDWQSGSDLFFSGNKRRIELGSALIVGQVESIGFQTARTAYIANEKTEYNGILIVPTSTRLVDFSAWVPTEVSVTQPEDVPKQSIQFYPNPCSGTLFHRKSQQEQMVIRSCISNAVGATMMSWVGLPEQLDLSGLPAGAYFLTLERAGGTFELYRVNKTGQR